jgi:hypothetical protein
MAVTHKGNSGNIVIRPQPAVATARGGVPMVTIGLSPEKLREVHTKLNEASLEGTEPETLAELIEPASPELARRTRGMTQEQLQGWISILLGLFAVLLG